MEKEQVLLQVDETAATPAVVLGGGVSGLAIVRSLGKRGIPVIVLDSDPQALGFASRYSVAGVTVPGVVKDEEGAIEELLAVGRQLKGKSVLLPSSDQWMHAVAKHADRLTEYFLLPPSDLDVLGKIVDKREFYNHAQEAGIPVPPYALVSAHEPMLPSQLEGITFPCVVKPAVKSSFPDVFGQSAVLIRDEDELSAFLRAAAEFDLIVQSMVKGGENGLKTVAIYVDRNGDLKAVLNASRAAVYPPEVGTSCVVQTCLETELVEETMQVMRHLNYRGVAEVEYVYDPKEDTWKVIDMNPRFWKWVGMPIAAGVDLPWLAYNDALENEVEEARVTRHVTWTSVFDLAELYGQSGNYLEWKAGMTESCCAWHEHIVDAVFSQDDPFPVMSKVAKQVPTGQIACKC